MVRESTTSSHHRLKKEANTIPSSRKKWLKRRLLTSAFGQTTSWTLPLYCFGEYHSSSLALGKQRLGVTKQPSFGDWGSSSNTQTSLMFKMSLSGAYLCVQNTTLDHNCVARPFCRTPLLINSTWLTEVTKQPLVSDWSETLKPLWCSLLIELGGGMAEIQWHARMQVACGCYIVHSNGGSVGSDPL